ncbi:hypothetical protein ABEB36_006752 [Hypothenemus hampei]|uniref:RING-type E3 ubiquitin transferase n=1 Tax=Hypothenemus hampei TaxID=57062 RepID=A0ABD1ETW7_HYPHA
MNSVEADSRKRKSEDGNESSSSSNKIFVNESSKNLPLCPICFSTKKKLFARPNFCNHKFCYKCLKMWSKHRETCPLCRVHFTSIIVTKNWKYNAKIRIRKYRMRKHRKNHLSAPIDEQREILNTLFNAIKQNLSTFLGSLFE